MGVCNHDGEKDRDGCREGHGVRAGGNKVDKDHKREKKVGSLKKLHEDRELLPAHTLQAELLRLQVDADEDAEEIQHRRQDRADDDVRIGDAHIFCHEKRGGAHDGGHDLTARGRGGFDRPGKLRLVTRLFHHGDGDGARGNGVADGGTGYHAAQGGGDDGDLCGTTGEAADQGVCKVDEELGNAGALKERAENDEHNDKFRTDLHRRAQDAAALHLIE